VMGSRDKNQSINLMQSTFIIYSEKYVDELLKRRHQGGVRSVSVPLPSPCLNGEAVFAQHPYVIMYSDSCTPGLSITAFFWALVIQC